MSASPTVAAGAFARSCGTCTLCCKVYDVPPIDNKPRGAWCKHCKPGKGCGIWQDRPQFCRDFHCHWIKDDSFGEEWKPEKSKFVMNYRPDQNAFAVVVDPGFPGAWLKEPYHSGLRRLAGRLAQQKHVVQISINHDIWVIGPQKDFHVGITEDDLSFTWTERRVAGQTYVELAAVHIVPSKAA
jgi:hypothetical protein